MSPVVESLGDTPPSPPKPLPVLGKVEALFEYVRDERGRPTGATRDQLAFTPVDPIVTAKFDGTCCYIRDGEVYARQDVKHNVANAPAGWFQTAEKDAGGHIIGFRPLGPQDKWHRQAIDGDNARFIAYDVTSRQFYYVVRPIAELDGRTVELLGPSVNGNKHKLTHNAFIPHGSVVVDAPWSCHSDLRAWLAGEGRIYEGIVVHDLGNNTLRKCHRGHLGGACVWKSPVQLPMRD